MGLRKPRKPSPEVSWLRSGSMSQVILVLVCFATAFTLSSAILIDVLNGHPSFASVTITINQETCTAPFGDICKIGELPAGLVNVTVFDGSGNILRRRGTTR